MIYPVYSESHDMTFIMEEIDSTLSVMGFYFGEPYEKATEQFYNELAAEIETIEE